MRRKISAFRPPAESDCPAYYLTVVPHVGGLKCVLEGRQTDGRSDGKGESLVKQVARAQRMPGAHSAQHWQASHVPLNALEATRDTIDRVQGGQASRSYTAGEQAVLDSRSRVLIAPRLLVVSTRSLFDSPGSDPMAEQEQEQEQVPVALLGAPQTLPISGAVAPNRFFKAPTEEYLCQLGATIETVQGKRVVIPGRMPSTTHLDLYQAYAQGGWGIITTGNVMVDPTQLGGPMDIALPILLPGAAHAIEQYLAQPGRRGMATAGQMITQLYAHSEGLQ